MNSRHAIIIMLTLGVAIVTALTLTPYVLMHASPAQVFAERDRDPSPPTQTGREAVKAVVAAEPDLDAAAWYAERGEEPQRHGVLIETVNRKKVLASLNPDAAYNPASLTKLATTLAAIKKLGADYRFETRVFAEGEIDAKGTLQGTLRVDGADPTFGDIAANFIAKELKGRGIKKVRDELAVSPGFALTSATPKNRRRV
ncbi:MAG: D-alanyl-D-alanine carboxypeptidase [Pyrinomonadaceae bacterium]